LHAFTPIHRQLFTSRNPTKHPYDLQNTRYRGEALLAYPVAESVATEAGKEANADQQPKGPGWVSVEQLGELKDLPIVSVIESYGLEGFERKGDNRAMAVCPFHNDRNPSLNIDGNRRLYKCFSCGAGGDVFNFVREFGKLKGQEMSFYEAVRHVSSEFGDGNIGTGSTSSSGGPRMSDEKRQELQAKKERVALANAAADTFYTQCLAQPSGGRARSHLQSRAPSSCRSFALDTSRAYFGGGPTSAAWKPDHLKDLLTAQEILTLDWLPDEKRDVPVFSSIEEPRAEASDCVATYCSIHPMPQKASLIIATLRRSSPRLFVAYGSFEADHVHI
jgi:DNA primase